MHGGRYKVTPGEFSDLKARFNLEEIPLFKPRYNIAPTHQAPVTANLGGANRVELFQWELVGEIDARSNLATSILMRNSDWLDKGTMNFPTEPGVKLL